MEDIIVKLSNLKNQAMKKGAWKTFRAIEKALDVAGWELAERKEAESKKEKA